MDATVVHRDIPIDVQKAIYDEQVERWQRHIAQHSRGRPQADCEHCAEDDWEM